MTNVSTRIAYVTDLHLGNAPGRITSFTQRLGQLRRAGIGCVINGGDMFDLRQDMWQPNGLVDTPLSAKQLTALKRHSAQLVIDNMPEIIGQIAGFEGFLSVVGNGDWMAQFPMSIFINNLREDDFGKASILNSTPELMQYSIIENIDHGELVLSGIGGIPALPFDRGALSLNGNNPWYKGVLTEKEFGHGLALAMFSSRNTVFISHMPALGTFDSFFHKVKKVLITGQGSADIRDLVEKRMPILHLTGHVHDAPLASGSYKPFSVSANGRTVTVNPGGADIHDKEIDGIPGVKVAVIDPYKLIEMRKANELTEAAIESEKAVEILK